MANNAFVAGYTLFVGEKVTLDVMGASAVDATVRGEIARVVNLRARQGRLAIKCACAPEAMSDPAGCKHAWATMLAIDKHGTLDDLRASRGKIVLVPWGEEAAPPSKSKKTIEPPRETKATRQDAKAPKAAKVSKEPKPPKEAKVAKRTKPGRPSNEKSGRPPRSDRKKRAA